MEDGPAQCGWVREGGAIRRVPFLPEPEMTFLPDGDPIAIVCATCDAIAVEQAFETLLLRLYMIRYGNAEARAHMREWRRSRSAA